MSFLASRKTKSNNSQQYYETNNSNEKTDPYLHLFYKRKTAETKPPLHAKSFNEDFEEKTIKTKLKEKNSNKKIHKKNVTSCDFDEDSSFYKKSEYDYLKQKTQSILNELHRIKSKSNHSKNEKSEDYCKNNEKSPYSKYENHNLSKNNAKTVIPSENDEFKYKSKKIHRLKDDSIAASNKEKQKQVATLDTKANHFNDMKQSYSSSEFDSVDQSKENRSFYSNFRPKIQENINAHHSKTIKTNGDWNKNKKDIEMLSNIHEKDLEIIELKNKITKYEIEAKSLEGSFNKVMSMNEKYKQDITKLQQEKNLKDKEIEYLKKYKNKLEDDIKNAKNNENSGKVSYSENTLLDKNKEIIELKEKILINNAEHRIQLTAEKEKYEAEIKSRDNIIKEKNKQIFDLEQYKAQNSPYYEQYQNLLIKMKDIEQKNQMLSEENCSLISKIESKKEEKASLDTLIKEFRLFFMQYRIKISEIRDIGEQIFEISRQILSGEEINIDLLVGLIKPNSKPKPKKNIETAPNSSSSNFKATLEEINTMKEQISSVYDKFKADINEIYEVYVKKCGENCNIQ